QAPILWPEPITGAGSATSLLGTQMRVAYGSDGDLKSEIRHVARVCPSGICAFGCDGHHRLCQRVHCAANLSETDRSAQSLSPLRRVAVAPRQHERWQMGRG